jgi:branched-chain amino acid transport system substrate-binding protein
MAIERAGSIDRMKVCDELAKMSDMTFWGPVKFSSTGQITSLESPVIQIQSGRHVAIYPASIRQGELRLGVN